MAGEDLLDGDARMAGAKKMHQPARRDRIGANPRRLRDRLHLRLPHPPHNRLRGGEVLELEIAIPQYSWVRTGRAKVDGPGTISGLPYRELVPGSAPGIGNPKTASARSPLGPTHLP